MKQLKLAIILIITLSFLFINSLFASQIDEIKKAIYQLQPKLSKVEVNKLAHALLEVSSSEHCDIEWPVLLAVAFNESSLLKSSVNNQTNDYGLMQINKKNIVAMKLNIKKLMINEKYSITAACSILTDNKNKLSFRYPFWIGAYRSGVALWKHPIQESAKRYDKVIKRLVQQIGYSIMDSNNMIVSNN